jgi:hypothetical protein
MSTNGVCRPIELSEADRARFLAKVARRQPSECWLYTGSKFRDGYGQFSAKVHNVKRNLRSNKVAYYIANGPIPDGMDVCHSCDNRPCCNPGHLWLGTHKQNNDDKVAKRRQASGEALGSRIKERCLRGTAVPHSKLDPKKVREIRSRVGDGEQVAAVARKFGVTPPAIWSLLRGKSWSHVV